MPVLTPVSTYLRTPMRTIHFATFCFGVRFEADSEVLLWYDKFPLRKALNFLMIAFYLDSPLFLFHVFEKGKNMCHLCWYATHQRKWTVTKTTHSIKLLESWIFSVTMCLRLPGLSWTCSKQWHIKIFCDQSKFRPHFPANLGVP